MAGFSTGNDEHLTRSQIWSTQLKEVLEDELFAMKYVDMLNGFPDGDTFNIPSIGQAEVRDYDEGQAIQYTAMDTGNFTFTITEYKSAATYIYNKFKQDSFYMNQLVSSFVPKMQRALMKAYEVDVLKTPTPSGTGGQTTADTNTISGARHRWVASGTNEVISVEDYAKALYALQKANVPATNLIAIVDPSCEYELNTLTNLVNVSNNPRWEGIVSSGISSGMKFIKNIYGFDTYCSQNLHVNTASETIGSDTASAGVNNLFFSASGDVLPIVGSMRQPVSVESEYNKDMQRDEYVTTMRYGLKLYRPENMCVVLSDTDQVY